MKQLNKKMYFLCLIPPVAVLASMKGSARKLFSRVRSIFFSGILSIGMIVVLYRSFQLPTWHYDDVLVLTMYCMTVIIHAVIVVNRENYWRSGKGEEKLKRKQEEQEKYRQQRNREALIAELTDIAGISDKLARTILDQFPTRESITGASEKNLTKVPGVGDDKAAAIKARLG